MSGFQGGSLEVLKEPWLISLFLVLAVNPGGITRKVNVTFHPHLIGLSGQGNSNRNKVAGFPYLVHINEAVRRNTGMIRFWDVIRVFFF